MATHAEPATELASQVQALMRRPYRRVVQGNPEEGYLGFVPELPGCMTAGETPAEALANLDEALAAWLESALSRGLAIPDPLPLPSLDDDLAQYSGKLLLRMPKMLHRDLALLAQREGVSINQLAVSLIARGVQ